VTLSNYTVMASCASRGAVALEDDDGRCHLAMAVKTVPPAGSLLQGQSPALGLRPLRIVVDNRPCAVTFLLLDCHPVAATRAIAEPHAG
jgi:hypothetical protein